MKKILATLAALLTFSCVMALPKAIYVKKGNDISKYNFGVAEDLVFSNGGHTLKVTGYDETINLDEIDYITFNAPIDQTAMAPSAQKEKLVKIGEKLNSLFDLNDLADMARMYENFFRREYAVDQYYGISVSEFQVPREYWDVHNSVKSVMKSAADLCQGKIAAVRSMKTAAVELYKFSDYSGIYAADTLTHAWKKTGEASYFQMSFPGKGTDTFSVKVTPSNDYSTWESNENYTIQAPKTLTVEFFKNTTKLADAVVKSDLVNKSKIDVDVDFNASNYVVKNKLNVVDNLATDVVDVTFKGQYICHCVSTVDGKNLVNFDTLRDDIEAVTDHDENGEWIDGNPDALIAHFIRGKADADILGELQLKGRLSNLKKICDNLKMSTDYESYQVIDGYTVYGTRIRSHNNDYSDITLTYTDSEALNKKINTLNNYFDCSFYYDKTDKLQGYCSWLTATDSWEGCVYNKADIDNNYWWVMVIGDYLVNVQKDYMDGYWYYSKYPVLETGELDWMNEVKERVSVDELVGNCVTSYTDDYETISLVFPDMTSFSFEEYFDKTSFQKLVDDYNEIINTYDTITGQN